MDGDAADVVFRFKSSPLVEVWGYLMGVSSQLSSKMPPSCLALAIGQGGSCMN